MLKVKSLLVIFALVIAFIGTSVAKDLPGDKAGKKADYLFKKLSLTNDQYTRVYQILFDYESKAYEKCHAKGHKCDDKCKTECKTIQANVLGEIDKVLNKDQITKFTPLKEKFFKMTFKKKIKKVTNDESINKEVKKDEKKDVKKEVGKDVKKDEKKK